MDVVYARCCGLDLHKRAVAACVIAPGPQGAPRKTIRTFGTMTEDLLALADWLTAEGVTHVAMESTGVYGQPVWNLLEGGFALLLANARHIKAVPGRKTEGKDCEWVAALLRHGLLRGGVVPDRPQRALRELTRYRTSLVRERAAEANRLQKTLEGANIKLASVATDILGTSGREILAALVAGADDGAALAALARGVLRTKLPELARALTGRAGAHQRFLLAQQRAPVDFLDERIAAVGVAIAARLRSDEEAVDLLDTLPGVGRPTAEALVAELGTAMERFPPPGHRASWAGMCPGNHERAGKRTGGKTRKGRPWPRAALVEAARAAARAKQTYLAAQYRRLAARRGAKRAAVAVGHTILAIAYHLLRRRVPYQDLGSDYFDARDRQAVERRLVHRLEGLGDTVTLDPAAG